MMKKVFHRKVLVSGSLAHNDLFLMNQVFHIRLKYTLRLIQVVLLVWLLVQEMLLQVMDHILLFVFLKLLSYLYANDLYFGLAL